MAITGIDNDRFEACADYDWRPAPLSLVYNGKVGEYKRDSFTKEISRPFHLRDVREE